MRTQWNDAEDRALDYLPHVDQIIYLRGIRVRMDYATGIAGMSPDNPISYGWLSQLCEVRPDPCSTIKPPPRLVKDQLRSVFKRLDRAGLIEWVRDHGLRSLVFRCILADRSESARNMSHPSATHEPPTNSHPRDARDGASCGSMSHPSGTNTANGMSHPIPVSGIRKDKDSANALIEFADREHDDGPSSLPVRIVFDYWREVMGHHKAKLDGKRRRCIAGSLKHYSVEDLKRAIDGCKASAWHQGKNRDGKVFDDIALICRDAEHVERFRGGIGLKRSQDQALEAWLSESDADVIEGECRHV
jgi:hypothetical protein